MINTRVGLLGPLNVETRDGPVTIGSAKERAVLSLLAVRAGKPVSEGELAEALWGEDPPRSAHKAIQNYVSNLRRRLPENVIATTSNGYALSVEPDEVDALRFDTMVGQARRSRTDQKRNRAALLLDEALALWRGEPLTDLADQPSGMAEIARLQELRRGAEEDLAELRLERGDHHAMVATLEAAVAAEPLRERRWAHLMMALYRCGRQADALRAYRRLRTVLGEELGIEPSAELVGLEESILLQKPELDWSPEPTDATLDTATPTIEPPREALPTGVVTFVLTDIEASSQLWEANPNDMAAALERHDRLIERAVAGRDGVLLKSKGEGDSTLSVFRRASDAVAAAVFIRTVLEGENWPGSRAPRVRIGLHTGEAYERDGDYYGPTLNRAARIRGLAEGGQTLLSTATAELVHDRLPAGARLLEIGERRLRGLSRAERVFLLTDTEQSDSVTSIAGPQSTQTRTWLSTSELPSPLIPIGGAPMVGRSAERDFLQNVWGHARGGRQRAALISGEPGIGKTYLAAELARFVQGQDGLVLYGRCDEDLGVPYQPFVEALRFLVHAVAQSTSRPDLGPLAGELARLLPELGEMVPDLAPPTTWDPESERHLLFEAVTGGLAAVSAKAPVLLVLDDLHWATKPTLLLLRHLLASARPMAMMVVGTYWDTEPSVSQPLPDLLADMWRIHGVERMPLHGLTSNDVVDLITTLAGRPLDNEDMTLARQVQEQTGGNPFFVGQLLRHLEESAGGFRQDGRLLGSAQIDRSAIPHGVREVIGRRLGRLEKKTKEVLEVAAVIGRDFDLDLLTACSAMDDEVVLGAIDEAESTRFVTAVYERRAGFAFSHAIARLAIYDQIPSIRRSQTHRRVAHALEQDDAHVHLDELAHHFSEAAHLGELDKAIEYNLLAGVNALQRLAYEEGAQWCERALSLLASDGRDRHPLSCIVWLLLGQARTAAGNWAEARVAYLEAGEQAIANKDGERLVAAALGYRGQWQGLGEVDPELERLLGQALSVVKAEEGALRSQLLARLATARFFASGDGEAQELSEEALALARDSDDLLAQSISLHARHVVLWEPSRASDRLATTETAFDLAGRLRSTERMQIARWDRIVDLLQLGRVAEAATTTRAYGEEAKSAGRPLDRWWSAVFEASVATATGRFDEAEQLSTEGLTVGREFEPGDAWLVYGVQQFALRWAQARLGELAADIDALVESYAATPELRAGLAVLLAEQGDLVAARNQLGQFLDSTLPGLRRGWQWLSTVALLAHGVSQVGWSEPAEQLYALLEPYRGTQVLLGPGLAAVGPVDRWLGLLAGVGGDRQLAVRHLSEAGELVDRWGVTSWAPIVHLETATAIAAGGSVEDGPVARKLARTSLAEAGALGIARVHERAGQLVSQLS